MKGTNAKQRKVRLFDMHFIMQGRHDASRLLHLLLARGRKCKEFSLIFIKEAVFCCEANIQDGLRQVVAIVA